MNPGLRMRHALFLFAFVLLAPAAAQANVTRLMAPGSSATADLRGYDRIVVLAPQAALAKPPKDPADAARVAGELAARANEFADDLAARLRESAAFAEVSREPLDGRALVLRGRVLKFREANVVQRALGLFQGARLEAEFEVVDAESGRLLARAEADFSGGLRPGSWTNLVRTMDGFVNGAAARLHDELLVAADFREREEVGRAARGREKYTDDE